MRTHRSGRSESGRSEVASGPRFVGPSAAAQSLIVFKFGGTSVGAADRFRRIVDIVTEAARTHRVVVIVSALAHVTRQLSAALDDFTTDPVHQPAVLDELLAALRTRHREQAAAVLSSEAQMQYAAAVEKRLGALRRIFEAVRDDGFSPALRDAVLASGEQLSVPMMALALRDAGLDAPAGEATALLCTDDTFGEANVRLSETTQRLRGWYAQHEAGAVPVLAGFIGGAPDGRTTTLGFEGSDYSAALVASVLGATRLVRYTDVDGLYTKDPNANADAERIERLAMEKAFALTESGRLGMHPKTLRPLVEAGIPLHIRSILEPEAPGTQIVPEAQMARVADAS